ncbi:Ras guanine nucleotide exchange factor glfB-like C-terminal domain-containing protein [Entamoeba marina]
MDYLVSVGVVFFVIITILVVLKFVFGKSNTNTNTDFVPPIIEKKQMISDIKEVYNRNLADTSLFIDLPRLASKIRIYKDSKLVVSGPKVTENNPMYPSEHCIKEVVSSLAQCFGEKKTLETLQKSFLTSFPYIGKSKQGDAAIFARSYLEDSLNENSLIVSVLKTIPQCLFASAVQYFVPLRLQFPYKDVNNGWNIDIHITNSNVIVKHFKREASLKKDEFFFEWSLQLTINRQTQNIDDIKIGVEYVNFGKLFNYKERQQFKDIVFTFD